MDTTKDLNTTGKLAVTFGVAPADIRDLFIRRGIKPAIVLNGLEYYDTAAYDAAQREFSRVPVMETRGARGRHRR